MMSFSLDKFLKKYRKKNNASFHVAIIGLLLFLLTTFMFPFRQQLLNMFFAKPTTHAVGDVTAQLVSLGNPFNTRFLSNPYARNAWDMQLYNGQIYFSHGDAVNNSGPQEIWQLDPTSGQLSALGITNKKNTICAQCTDDEQLDNFRVIDNELYAPGLDPWTGQGNAYWNFYRLGASASAWQKVETVDTAQHAYDMVKFTDPTTEIKRLFIAKDATTNIKISDNNGTTWASITAQGAKAFILATQRMYGFFELNGKLYGSSWEPPSAVFGLVGGNFLARYDGGNVFTYLDATTGNLMFPGYSAGQPPRRVHRPVNFGSQLVYLGVIDEQNVNGNIASTKWYPEGLYRATDVAAGQASKITLPNNALAWDILNGADGNVYVLASTGAPGDYTIQVFSSTDLTNWTEVMYFTSPTFARSFEKVGNDFYFGMGTILGTNHANAGNIVKATMPVAPSDTPVPTATPTTIPTPTPTIIPTPTGTVSLPLSLPVLVLEYLPTDPNNPTLLDGVETGWNSDATIDGRTLQFWQQQTDDMVQTAIPLINDATRFQGYKNPSAPQFLNYSVLETRRFYTPIPRGYQLGLNQQGQPDYRPDYASILTNLNICNYVDNQGVKEVWMYGYHSSVIVPDESRMSSSHGDISNSSPKEANLPVQYRMPICSKAYVLYNFTYQPGGGLAIGNNIHNRIHQLENVIPYAEGSAYYPPTRLNTANSIFWGSFSEYIQFDPETKHVNPDGTRKAGYISACGNAHIPPNWSNAKTQEYQYNLATPANFTCENWHPDPALAQASTFSCTRWGCTDLGFYKYFMQNMPGYNNGIVNNGQSMRNWWEAMYDFNAFIDQGRTLYEGALLTPTPTTVPTAVPTNTPIPTVVIPTLIPTNLPTIVPTNIPTNVPTIQPTNTPVVPTIIPTYTLSGQVYDDANENGIQDNGEQGFSGATVTLTTGNGPLPTTTDGAGNYLFGNLLAGGYTVVLTLPSGYKQTTALSLPVSITTSTVRSFGITTIQPSPTPTTLTIMSTPQTSAASQSAQISWTTNFAASSQVEYALETTYNNQSPVTNVATGVTNHTVTLSSLRPCAIYRFRVKSTDTSATALSNGDKLFTKGCTANSSVIADTTVKIATASGGTANLLNTSSKGITLQVPQSFAAQDTFFQIQQLDKTTFITAVSSPQGVTSVGNYLYHLNALPDTDTTVATFNTPLTVTIAYDTTDISSIDENTLTIHRFDGITWHELSNCAIDKTAKTVTCTTTAFSDFMLFGQPLPTAVPTPIPTTAPAAQPGTGGSSGGGGGGGGGGSSSGGSSGSSTNTESSSGSSSGGGGRGDLNGDGRINIFDLSTLLRNFGRAGAGDINSNGKVDIFDLSTLLRNFGK